MGPSGRLSQAPKALGEGASITSPVPKTPQGSTYPWGVTLDICTALIRPDLALH